MYDADCNVTDELVELATNSSTASATLTAAATTATETTIAAAAAAAGADVVADGDAGPERPAMRLDISPTPNDHGELVRAVGSSVVFTCQRVSTARDGDDDGGGGDGGGGDLAGEATTVEWFDKNDMRIRSQTAAHRFR